MKYLSEWNKPVVTIGLRLGRKLGCVVTMILGASDGGLLEGVTLGRKGVAVGRLEVSNDGASEGFSVGLVLGTVEEMNEGKAEGIDVGLVEGFDDRDTGKMRENSECHTK